MTRVALARHYRPRRFAEVAMQEHVSETLKAAVARGRTAHAYLFCGPRGVGKTTAARVLAMALNCPERDADGEPCGGCESCERIWSGRTSLDVVEIDAASNRGVDDARDLRERAMYAPTDEDRYKVYIIDEAHMLTREAWNALLKILEEPPPRVIFVFATTEPQKIQQAAPPILSRCQRFDFRRISVTAIVERLREVLDAEGVEADEEALVPIARRAEGGLRDALSLLDQVLSVADGRLDADAVRRMLGLVGEEMYLELFEIIADRRHADVFRFVERLLDEGYDPAEFYRGLADALRTVLIVKFDGVEAAEVRTDLRDAFARHAEAFDVGDLLRMLAQVSELDTEGRLRKSGNPRIVLEAMLLRFAHLERTIELEDLIRAAGSGSGGGADGGSGGSSGGGAAPGGGPRPGGGSGGVGPPRSPAGKRGSGSRSVRRSGGAGAGGGASAEDPADARLPAGAASTGSPGTARAGAVREVRGAPTVDASPATDGAGKAAEEAESTGTPPSPDPAAGNPVAAFRAVLRSGDGIAPGLRMFLKVARAEPAAADRLVVRMPPGPGLERLSSEPAPRRTLEDAISGRVGRRIAIDVEPLEEAAGEEAETPRRLTAEKVQRDQLERMASEEPVLRRAVQEWDLELVD